MTEPKMGDKMNMTYTGCVEAVNHGGSFLLTHIADGEAMMSHDGMMKDDSKMARDSKMANKDEMMLSTLALSGRSDLKKYVGQKVTVTGAVSRAMAGSMSNDRDTLAVASLKVVAKSCS